MGETSTMETACQACGHTGMRLLTKPNPNYVQQCAECKSTFFSFGRESLSHGELYNDQGRYQQYLEAINESSASHRHEETLLRLAEMVPGGLLFDIGAGAGAFLESARNHGFRVAGNEISQPAIEACRSRGIDLFHGDDLTSMPDASHYDAATMWCVIAHVDDPSELLQGVRALLRPGGVLFFSTPRYCLIDQVAWLIHRLDRRVFDRRINRAHRRQYTKQGLETFLLRQGFTPISVEPKVGYGLHMAAYLEAIGMPQRLAVRAGAFLDRMARRGWLPRNVLDVYAHTAI